VLVKWSTKELVAYLHKSGFSEDTRHAIKKGKVTGETLLKLENASLHALGVVKLGEHKRLLFPARSRSTGWLHSAIFLLPYRH
jgi:hypothetical protein